MVWRIWGDGTITHNSDVENRKACWRKCIINKLNQQQSLPAAFLHWAADMKALSRAPQLLQVLMSNEEQLQRVSPPPYVKKKIKKKWQWLQMKSPGRPLPGSWTVSLYHSCFYCGGVSWKLFLRGLRKGPLQGSLTLSAASVPSDSLFYSDCPVIRTSCTE